MLQRERECQILSWDTGWGAGELFETGWVEEGLCKCPWSSSRVLCSRYKGHWSWDIDLFSWNTSTKMQRISFVAACEFLLMFPGVYLKVTSIWERVWDCFVFFPFPHVQSLRPYKWLHKLLTKTFWLFIGGRRVVLTENLLRQARGSILVQNKSVRAVFLSHMPKWTIVQC